MDRQTFLDNVNKIFTESELNYIPREKALADEFISVKMFEPPIIAVTNAKDHAFQSLKQDDIIGEHFMLPTMWLPTAKSVISFFLPFTEIIRKSNRESVGYPSKGWMNGRIEGQNFINVFSSCMVSFLNENGYEAVSPSVDERFFSNVFPKADNKNATNKPYTSNWSERHVAYVCGLGTFSLSKGLITEKGTAGRFTSIITALDLPEDDKKFNKYDENCIMCGKCIKNCPAGAISFGYGKNHDKCSEFLSKVLSENSPWYGCGKCQVDVPCEFKNPKR